MRQKIDRRFGPLDFALVAVYAIAFIVVLLDVVYWRVG